MFDPGAILERHILLYEELRGIENQVQLSNARVTALREYVRHTREMNALFEEECQVAVAAAREHNTAKPVSDVRARYAVSLDAIYRRLAHRYAELASIPEYVDARPAYITPLLENPELKRQIAAAMFLVRA